MRQRRLRVAAPAAPARPRRARRGAKHRRAVRRLRPRPLAALCRREQVRRRTRVAAHALRVVEQDVEAQRRARRQVRQPLRSGRVVGQRHQDAEKHPDHALRVCLHASAPSSLLRRAAAVRGRTRMSTQAARTYAGPKTSLAGQAAGSSRQAQAGRENALRRPSGQTSSCASRAQRACYADGSVEARLAAQANVHEPRRAQRRGVSSCYARRGRGAQRTRLSSSNV